MPKERDWSAAEIDAIVADYFDMRSSELAGRSYVKAEHRRALQRSLSDRSEGSIEMKHCNISAVLAELGEPYINGYKPRKNLQQALRDAVKVYLRQYALLSRIARTAPHH